MARQKAGEAVKAGFYWRMAHWQIVTIAEDGERLPGNAGEPFLRIPALMMLLLAPVMGGLFVMFLPFIGIAIVVQHALRSLGRTVHKTAEESGPAPKEQGR
jgi:hypothetical protein